MQHTIFLFEESNDLNYMFVILINESSVLDFSKNIILNEQSKHKNKYQYLNISSLHLFVMGTLSYEQLIKIRKARCLAAISQQESPITSWTTRANLTSSSESEELLEESELDEEEDEYLTKHKTIKACEIRELVYLIKSLKNLVKSI